MRAWVDFSLMMTTFIFTLLWSVEVGIVVSVTVSLLLVVRNASKTSIKILVSYVLAGVQLIVSNACEIVGQNSWNQSMETFG